MFLTQDDDLAQQYIVADFLLLWSLVAYCTTLYDDITESILQFKICCTRSKFVSFMWNRMKICHVMWYEESIASCRWWRRKSHAMRLKNHLHVVIISTFFLTLMLLFRKQTWAVLNCCCQAQRISQCDFMFLCQTWDSFHNHLLHHCRELIVGAIYCWYCGWNIIALGFCLSLFSFECELSTCVYKNSGNKTMYVLASKTAILRWNSCPVCRNNVKFKV